MDAWVGVISQIVITGGTVAGAWLALRGKLAEIGKDSAAAKVSAHNANEKAGRVYESMNNSPESLSTRIANLPTKDDLAAVVIDVKAVFEKERGLRGIVNAQGRRIDEHIAETAPMLPMLIDLHAQYAGKKGGTL